MEAIINFIYAFDNLCWDYAFPVLLIGSGIFFTILFKGKYLFNIKQIVQNSIGYSLKKNSDGQGTVSAFNAAMTNLGNTVGTGNISGVASAIAAGGPGAVFWMWVISAVCAVVKSAEIILGLRYRVRKDGEVYGNRDFIMGSVMGWRIPAAIFAFLAVITQPLNAIVQTSSIVSALDEAFGFNKTATMLVVIGLLFIIIMGGLKRISGFANKAVPTMCALYLILGIAIIIINFRAIPTAFASVFRYAFTPKAGAGGALGYTVMQAFRYGSARGLYSTDSGIGAAMCTYAASETDHPGRQACWGLTENFIDTFIVCTITTLAILTTGVYETGETGAALATIAFGEVFGVAGKAFLAIATAIFAFTTLTATFYQNTISLNYLTRNLTNRKIEKAIMISWTLYFCLPQFLGTLDADFLWAVADASGVFNIICTIAILFALRKEAVNVCRDFFERYLPACERGENPDPVNYITDI